MSKPKKRERGGRPVPAVASRDVPVQIFRETVPGAELLEALESSKDTRFEMLSRLILDPARRSQSFASKLQLAGVTLVDMYDFWNKHQLHVGLLGMLNHVPKILIDVAIDAEARIVPCTRCDGQGQVVDMVPGSDQDPVERECPVCKGSKEMRVVGDKAARDLVFESIGLTGKRSPMVAIQQNFGLDAELGDVLIASQKVITGGTGER